MNQLAEEENQDLSELPNESRETSFISGSVFFTERIRIPEDVSGAAVESFLETQLEMLSPFSTDQLSWGSVLDGNGQGFLYAKFNNELDGDQESDESVLFPHFVPFLGYIPEKPCVLCAVKESTVSLIVYDEAGQLPIEIHSLEVASDDVSDELVSRVCADLFRELPWIDLPVIDEVFRFQSMDKDWKGNIRYVSEGSHGGVIDYTLTRKQAYLADIRDVSVKSKALSEAQLNYVLWLSSVGALALIVVLSVLSFGKFIWDVQIDKQMKKADNQQQQVDLIERKSRNLAMFESGSAARLQPLAMLDIINRIRPDGLYFSKFISYEGRRLDIEGMAEQNGTSLVNQFKSNLDDVNQLESHQLDITRISQGSTFFKLSLVFKDIELADVGVHE